MLPDLHKRAQGLVDQSPVEGISPADQRWLDSHLAGCRACAEYAESSLRAIEALSGFAFEVDSDAAMRVEQTVRARAAEMAASPAGRLRALAFPIAAGLTVIGSAAMWQVASVVAARLNVPADAWHAALVACWIVPSAIVDGVLWLRGRVDEGSEGGLQ